MYDFSRAPDRPPVALGFGRAPDTNDAGTYYRAALSEMWFYPARASAALYWASQLNPGWADPYFARWFVLRNPRRQLPDSVQKRVDSLVLMAEIRNPFFDERLMMDPFANQVRGQAAMAQRQADAARKAENQRRLANNQPLLYTTRIQVPHTWYLAFAERQFDSASHDLAREISKHPDVLGLYVYRAKALYYLDQYDSAAAVLAAAVARIVKKDTTQFLPVYFSRELFYYSIGIAEREAKHDSSASVAFQHTVTENLGFYMAHLNLASQALKRRDTATAIEEARLAAQIRPSDVLAQLYLGYSLFTAGHPADAIDPLRTAIADDPYFALSYFYLAAAREAVHDTAGSIDGYRGFLAHAAQNDTLRKTARFAIVHLGGTL